MAKEKGTAEQNENRGFKVPRIQFMRLRHIATVISLITIVIAIVSLATRGLALGLDFTGGTLVEVEYQEPPSLEKIRTQLRAAGHENFVVQNFGTETAVAIRLPVQLDQSMVDGVMQVLQADEAQLTLKRSEFVGAQVGDELREKGGLGLLLALAVVTVYVALRFQIKFGVAAVLPLAHDVLVVLGFFSLFQWTFDLTVLAAMLAIVGYSLNDTIIVADRIRENFRRLRKGTAEEVVDLSINQTMTRTLNTSGTTLAVVLCLQFFGGEMIHGFSLAMSIGILVGTYSSIYVAANLLIAMGVTREDLLVPVKSELVTEDEKPPEWLNRM